MWSDEVRTIDEGRDPDSIRPAKGIHITVPWEKVRNDIAVVVPVPKDKRAVFVVPWGELTYIGTTDTDYDGPNEDPPVTRDDVDYLLGALKFTGITDRDVLGTVERLCLPDAQRLISRPLLPEPQGGAGSFLASSSPGIIGPDHTNRQRLAGVLDFGHAAVGDPAYDLAGLLSYGDAFVAALAPAYPGLEALLPRARFYKSTFALQEALFGLEHGDGDAFASGMAGYR